MLPQMNEVKVGSNPTKQSVTKFGELSEWSIEAVLKTVGRGNSPRGFESYTLRNGL